MPRSGTEEHSTLETTRTLALTGKDDGYGRRGHANGSKPGVSWALEDVYRALEASTRLCETVNSTQIDTESQGKEQVAGSVLRVSFWMTNHDWSSSLHCRWCHSRQNTATVRDYGTLTGVSPHSTSKPQKTVRYTMIRVSATAPLFDPVNEIGILVQSATRITYVQAKYEGDN